VPYKPAHAQKDSSYEQRGKKWRRCASKRPSKDALAQVTLFTQGQKENNEGQLIKALLYQLSCVTRVEENTDIIAASKKKSR